MSNIKIDSVDKTNNMIEEDNSDKYYKTIKKLMEMKKINLNNEDHLKYMLSLTLKEQQKDFDFQYLLKFLLEFKTEKNKHIFYEYYFQCCEMGNLNYIPLLINNQISINSQNELGETAMHIAIAKKDINLIKLLLNYNPNLSIQTYKDKLSCYNYADISKNEDIQKLVNAKINSSKEIKAKLKSFINDVETKDTLSSIESGIKSDILNYCGEEYKIKQKNDSSELKISDDEPLKINEINLGINNKNFFERNIYVKKMNYSSKGMILIKPKDISINKKEINSAPLKMNKTIYQKKKISLSKSENPGYKFLTEKKPKKKSNFMKDINLKNEAGNSYSLNILKKPNCNNIEEKENINNNSKIENNLNQIQIFLTEINLPKEYAQKFIDNGFDDFNLLQFQTKAGIALSNQNLKDIGIHNYGERSKILIHLEENAGIIPYFLEKDKIYMAEKDYRKNSENSLFKFLASNNLEQYENNFINNGYFSSELLFTQMLTRQPITKENLKEDFNIDKIGHRSLLHNNLIKGAKEYSNHLRPKTRIKLDFDASFMKACEPCCIY